MSYSPFESDHFLSPTIFPYANCANSGTKSSVFTTPSPSVYANAFAAFITPPPLAFCSWISLFSAALLSALPAVALSANAFCNGSSAACAVTSSLAKLPNAAPPLLPTCSSFLLSIGTLSELSCFCPNSSMYEPVRLTCALPFARGAIHRSSPGTLAKSASFCTCC